MESADHDLLIELRTDIKYIRGSLDEQALHITQMSAQRDLICAEHEAQLKEHKEEITTMKTYWKVTVGLVGALLTIVGIIAYLVH